MDEGSDSGSTSGGGGGEPPRSSRVSGSSPASQSPYQLLLLFFFLLLFFYYFIFFPVQQWTREGLFGRRKSTHSPCVCVCVRYTTIVFNCLYPKWMLITPETEKGQKKINLMVFFLKKREKETGDVLIASPLHHSWKIRGCEMWIPEPVAAGSCGDGRRKPMLDCPL